MRYLCLFLLLVQLGWLFAQAEEMPELNSENLQESWLNELYRQLDDGEFRIKAHSRSRFMDDNFNSLISLQGEDRGLRLNLNLYATQHKLEAANFSFRRFSAKTTLRELDLGNYRAAWGEGILLRKNPGQKSIMALSPAAHPMNYSPFGAAAALRQGDFGALILASGQERRVALDDGKISQIYTRRAENLAMATEAIGAAGLSYQTDAVELGALLYLQQYDKQFALAEYSDKLEAFSLAFRMPAEPFYFAAEGAIIEGKKSGKASIRLSLPKLDQDFGISSRQSYQLPAYASSPAVLSSRYPGHELNWNLDYEPVDKLKLGFRHVILKKGESLQSPKWLSRSILYVQSQGRGGDYLMQLTRLDKEIVASVDSSFIGSRPVHYRVAFRMQQNLSDYSSFRMLFRYHREDKQSLKNDGIFWENAFRFVAGKLNLELGLQSWQSRRTLLWEDTVSEDPSGIALAAGDDFACFFAPSFSTKLFRARAELKYSLQSDIGSFFLAFGF